MKQEECFGRTAQLEILEKRIRDLKDGYRQNIAIIGDELIGKTSLLYGFLHNFCDNRIIPVYLEVRPETLASFARRFLGVLLYNFLSNSALPLKEDLEFLVGRAERYIPVTAEKIRAILSSLQKRKQDDIFTQLLSLSESIHQETSKCCVIIFDEFHNLESLGVKKLYGEWSKILITQKNTMYIITSSMKFKARSILSKNLSLLFGNFEVVTVEPFDVKTSERYLEERLQGTAVSQGVKNFLVHFTGGHPFYLKLLTAELIKAGAEDSRLAEIIEELLFVSSGILNQKFSNYLKRFLDSAHSQEYLSILYHIASGSNKLKDIVHLLRKPKKEVLARVNHLLECDTVTRSGEFLNINDRVFGFWLKFVYQEKLRSLTFDAKNQKDLFRESVEGMIAEFLQSSRQPITERMAEVLRLFNDDVIQIEKRKVRLDHFREIKPLDFGPRGMRNGLLGRSTDAIWIIAFKNETLQEDDIAEFARECKRFRHKQQRKIIVAFNEVDPNARLKAMEEKIWTWDLNSLNHLLDAFFKPRIVT